MSANTSNKIVLWGGLAFVCGVAWTLGAAIPATITLAAMLGIVIVIILILASAISIIVKRPAYSQSTQIRYTQWEAPQEVEQPVQPRPEPKRLQAQPTRYTVLQQPQAQLPQAHRSIGASTQKRIEANR